jgi:NAD(P)-dependent dehydrogenase (short-subunit alcohol dehydrogenase family)
LWSVPNITRIFSTKTITANGELSASDLKVIGVACDVSVEDSVKQLFQTIHSHFGRIDVVVASAGIVHNYDAVDYPAAQMQRLYDINVHGALYTAREGFKLMQPHGAGSIVMVASMSAGIVNIPQRQFAYNASKAAVKHMAASLAVEWAKTGIRVNSLSPGYMLTKLTRTILANAEDQTLKVRTSLLSWREF